jgi:rhodanese-related sulfurtransferase
MSVIASGQLRDLRAAQPPSVLLDVRIPEDFDASHIAGARNACVFLMSFLDDVRAMVPDPAVPIVVYGADSQSLESTDAARRLKEAGFRSVHNYAGGLAAWKSDGLPTEGTGRRLETPILNGTKPLELSEARVEWTGRNLLNKHMGTLAVKEGSLTFVEGWLSSGEFVIDMTTMACTDIGDSALNALLIRHLQSEDFFAVDQHPEARMVIRKCSPLPNGRPGHPNLQLICDLTVRGLTREISMVAVGGRTPEGRVGIQAVFWFDRTEFGSTYGSGRFFRSLGKHLVNDLVEIQVRLMA